MKKIYFLLFTVIILITNGYSQVSVTVTNPTNTTPNLAASYSSLANAVIAYNGVTNISGPIIFTCAAGNETAPLGGYTLNSPIGASSTNSITFTTSGLVTITAFTPQISGNLNDAIFKLIGADYITIRNFTMKENAANTTTAAGTNNMTEWGVALLHSSVTDGAQHNTIQNNIISLNRTYQNTFGIYSNGRHSATAVTTTENITSVTGANFANKIYGNNISNVGYGIIFVGSSTAAFMDDGNDIGGSSIATGNTITNWGEGSTAISGYVSVTTSNFCIYANHQINENISYNTIISATVTGATFTFGGILKAYSTTTFSGGTITSTINNNTITLSSTNASGTMDGILNQNLAALSTATFSMNNNLITNCSISAGVTSSAFGGIIHSSAPGVLNITNNTIRGLTSTSTTGGYTGISNSGAVVTTINITNNKIGDAVSGAASFSNVFTNQVNAITNTGGASTATININNNSIDGFSLVTSGQTTFIQNQAASTVAVNINNNQLGSATNSLITFSGAQTSALFFLYNGGSAATTLVSISGNDIRGITHGLTASGQHQYIRSNSAALTTTINYNTLTGITANITSNAYFIMDIGSKASGASSFISGNSIITGYTKTGVGGIFYGINCGNSSVNGSTNTITNNILSDITVTGGAAIIGIAAFDGVSTTSGPTKTITGNTISNLTGGSSYIYPILVDYSAAATVSSNNISNITNGGDIFGIIHEVNNGQGFFTYSSNTISSLVSTGGYVDGFYCDGVVTVASINIHSNTCTGLSSARADGAVNGIDILNSAAFTNVYNNNINNLTVSGATTSVVNGVFVLNGTTINIYFNKINTLQATAAVSTSTAVNGILLSNGVTVTAHNNFIADLKAPLANMADAIRGIAVTSTTALSNYNLYYNSIYLNAASTGANFGTSGIYHASSATATTAALKMIDNIVVNTSTPNGTGLTAAYRRSNATLTNYATTSDNNLFYAGTASASRLIFSDGTNADQTLATYKTRVSTRDANAISLMPNFTSTTDLHLTATNNCAIDGYGIPVAGIIPDIDGNLRNVTTPDIGADEFTPTYSTLAGIAGAPTCENKIVSTTGTTFATSTCALIAKVLPSGGAAVSGKINTCVTLDATQQYFNSQPYVQRHFDIEPATSNITTTSATITLYFRDAEFVNFNTNTVGWPKLPTVAGGGNTDPNRANLKVTQYHGTATTNPSTPGNYTGNAGAGVLINPINSNIVWNGSYWAVTFDITGFSGFYVHTGTYVLPVDVNYFRGSKQGSNHLLDWKVTCNSTPSVTITLERSASATGPFDGLNTIAATAARCNQPFNYTDAQPLAGMNFYRLKITDADGRISYSSIVALLNAAKGFEIVNIVPNPVSVTGIFKLNISSAQSTKMDIVISDMQGRVVNRQQVMLIAGYNSIDMNTSQLAPGIFTIAGIATDEKWKVLKFVKQ